MQQAVNNNSVEPFKNQHKNQVRDLNQSYINKLSKKFFSKCYEMQRHYELTKDLPKDLPIKRFKQFKVINMMKKKIGIIENL